VEGKGFVLARRLARSDLLKTLDNRRVAVRDTTRRPGLVQVFNLRVANTHTYYAGGVWVHNAGDCPERLGTWISRELGRDLGARARAALKDPAKLAELTLEERQKAAAVYEAATGRATSGSLPNLTRRFNLERARYLRGEVDSIPTTEEERRGAEILARMANNPCAATRPLPSRRPGHRALRRG
jgi:hypothetical protein